MAKKENLYKQWFVTVTLGEFIGFIIPSVVGVLTVTANLPQIPQAFLMILAGMGEGAVLGYSQSRVLTRLVPKMKSSEWIQATVIGAAAAWFSGMLPSTVFEYILNVPLGIVIILGILLAAILLLSIGYMQYRILRRFFPRASQWIWANILAWVSGLIVLFIFMFAAPNGLIPTLLFSILGGLGMAATMSAITGTFLIKIVRK